MNRSTKLMAVLGIAGVAVFALVAAQLQTYPQVTTIGATDLMPFSQNLGGGNFNSPVNITGQNFATQMAILGGYPGLGLNNIWSGNNLHNGGDTFTGGITIPNIGTPPIALLWVNSGFGIRGVTLGPNIFLDALGNLTITTNVATNNLPLPVSVANGGTGEATASAAVVNLGAAFANGSTQFPGLFDTGPLTNSLLVLEANGQGQVITNIPSPPAQGMFLGSTNVTPGVAWFPSPTIPGSTASGSITATGWTNTGTGSIVVYAQTSALSNFTVSNPAGTLGTFNGASGIYTFPMGPGWKIVITSGGFAGNSFWAAYP